VDVAPIKRSLHIRRLFIELYREMAIAMREGEVDETFGYEGQLPAHKDADGGFHMLTMKIGPRKKFTYANPSQQAGADLPLMGLMEVSGPQFSPVDLASFVPPTKSLE